MNTSHSLLVSSTNLSFSYVALSSFFSPRASLSPSPLLFVQSTYSSLANRQRRNGRVIRSYLEKVWNLQIPPILFQVSLSIVLICLFSFDRFNLLLYYCFFFFFHKFLGARRSKSKEKKKKKENNVRSIILSSRFGHSTIIPYLFLKKFFFLLSLCFNGHRRSTGRTMDVRTIFRFANARYISHISDSYRG